MVWLLLTCCVCNLLPFLIVLKCIFYRVQSDRFKMFWDFLLNSSMCNCPTSYLKSSSAALWWYPSFINAVLLLCSCGHVAIYSVLVEANFNVIRKKVNYVFRITCGISGLVLQYQFASVSWRYFSVLVWCLGCKGWSVLC